MSKRQRLSTLRLVLMVGIPVVALLRAHAQQDVSTSTGTATLSQAKITYVSGATVYLDAGSDEGLAVGDVVEAVRGEEVVARLKVTYVTAKRASCSPEGAAQQLVVGDTVRFAKHAPAAADVASGPAVAGVAGGAVPTAKSHSGESTLRRAGIRGRVGASFLGVRDRSGYGQDFNQPSLSLLLTGTQVGGSPVDFAVDARPRRTTITAQNGTDTNRSSNRIYRANVTWRPGSFRLALGRQMSPSLAPLSLFDGLFGEYRRPQWAVGLFGGTQPDPESYGFSSDIRQFAGFVEGTSTPSASFRWWLNLGASTSRENGEINRDFVWLAGRFGWKGLTAHLQQEIDVNRGWRKEAEGSSFTNSGTFLALRWQIAPSWSVDGGFDSRRNVRLYRDLVTPVTQFDDATRQGYWAGAEWRPKDRFLVGVNGRHSGGGSAGDSDAYTLNLGLINLTNHAIDLRLRGTDYGGPTIDGWLASASLGLNVVSIFRLELHGGTRQDQNSVGFDTTETIQWYGVDLDFVAMRHMLAILSFDHTTGEFEANDQLFASISWRF